MTGKKAELFFCLFFPQIVSFFGEIKTGHRKCDTESFDWIRKKSGDHIQGVLGGGVVVLMESGKAVDIYVHL